MMHQQKWQQMRRSHEAGFTLVEMLVAITILAILLTVALLTIPNHDDRYWKDNLDQLVGSLNMAQEESALSGTPMLVQIDAVGWRFVPATGAASNAPANTMITMGGLSSNPTGSQQVVAGTSGLMPDVYRPQAWHKPVVIEPVQLTLGGEVITTALQIPLAQEQRKALLMRATNGRFSWANGVVP